MAVGTDGAVTPGGSGGNDVWATFDEVVDLSQFPARADYPDEATLYAARSAWLDANPAFVTGTPIPHPEYADYSARVDVPDAQDFILLFVGD